MFKPPAFHAADPATGQHFSAESIFGQWRETQDIAREAKADGGLPAIRQYAHQPRHALGQGINIPGLIALMKNRTTRFKGDSFTIRRHVIQRRHIQWRTKAKRSGSAFQTDIAFCP